MRPMTVHACFVEAMPLHSARALARLWIPDLEARIALAAARHNPLPVWCEGSAGHRPMVPCEHLATPRQTRASLESGITPMQVHAYVEWRAGLACMQAPVDACHIHAVKSSQPASTTSPRGCQASHSTASPGPSRLWRHLPDDACNPKRRPGQSGGLTHGQPHAGNLSANCEPAGHAPSRPPEARRVPATLKASELTCATVQSISLWHAQVRQVTAPDLRAV